MINGNGKYGGVLVGGEVFLRFIRAIFIGLEPWHPFYIEKRKNLYSQNEAHVTEKRENRPHRDELVLGRLLGELVESFSARDLEHSRK